MLTLEKITEIQAEQIAELHREIVKLKNDGNKEYYKNSVSELQDTLFLFHNKIDELKKENERLKNENGSLHDEIHRLNEDNITIRNQYNCVINSQSWRKTQFLRDILWRLKGNK